MMKVASARAANADRSGAEPLRHGLRHGGDERFAGHVAGRQPVGRRGPQEGGVQHGATQRVHELRALSLLQRQRNVRVAGPEPPEPVLHRRVERASRRDADDQTASLATCCLPRRLGQPIRIRKQPQGAVAEKAPCLGQFDTAGAARQQPRPDASLQLLQRAAQRRLLDPEPRGARETCPSSATTRNCLRRWWSSQSIPDPVSMSPKSIMDRRSQNHNMIM